MIAGLTLIVAGAAFILLGGALLPGLERRLSFLSKYPRGLASDPAAMAAFRRKNSRQWIAAGIVLVVVGLAALAVL